jgi:site-specific recombinase XerD
MHNSKLLGHTDVRINMIYTHVLDHGNAGIISLKID